MEVHKVPMHRLLELFARHTIAPENSRCGFAITGWDVCDDAGEESEIVAIDTRHAVEDALPEQH